MKKLILFFALAALVSCSNEDETTQSVGTGTSAASVLDGNMLSFKNDESFIEEYSGLSKLNGDQLQNWISGKKVTALLNTLNNSVEMEGDIIPQAPLIYSDALKSILNADSKVKIGNKIVWLNERNFYLLSENEADKSSKELISIKDNLKVYGQLLSSAKPNTSSETGRNVLPNENRTKSFASGEINVSGSRLRHVLDLFNETIVLNDVIQTSKMYLRSTLQYRSCSTFRCTWKEAANVRSLSTNLFCSACGAGGVVAPWGLTDLNVSGISGTQTFLLAEWALRYPLANPYANFAVSGPVTCQVQGVSASIDISWY